MELTTHYEVGMRGKDKLAQAHLDAIPLLLAPLIEARSNFKPITHQEAAQILRDWDKARKL